MIVICNAPFGWWSPAIQDWPVFWRECCFWSVRWFVGWSQFVPRWSGRWSRSRQSDCRTFRSVPIWDLGLQWLQNGRNLGILLFVNLWYFVQGKLCSSHQISPVLGWSKLLATDSHNPEFRIWPERCVWDQYYGWQKNNTIVSNNHGIPKLPKWPAPHSYKPS